MLIKPVIADIGFHVSNLIAQVVVFFLVYVVLSRYAFGPITDILEHRKKRIADGEAKLEKIARDLAAAEENSKAIIDKANTDAARLIKEANDAAASVGEKRTQDAVREAGNIIAKAREAAKLGARSSSSLAIEERIWTHGRGRHLPRHRQGAQRRRSGPHQPGSRRPGFDLRFPFPHQAMKISKDANRTSRQLLRACVDTDGRLAKRPRAHGGQAPFAIQAAWLPGDSDLSRALGAPRSSQTPRRHRERHRTQPRTSASQLAGRSRQARYGGDLEYEFVVKPELIGGLRVQVGSHVWDGSVRAKLDNLRTKLS